MRLRVLISRLKVPGKGQAVLSVVFIIGGVVVLIGTTLAILIIAFLNSSFGFQASQRALALAEAGVDDAVIQLVRDKDFSNVGYCVPAENTPCPKGYAQVSVAQDSPVAGEATIISDASVSVRRRRIQAVVSVSDDTGAVKFLSWNIVSP